jgi:hypothetical protein
MLQLLVRWTHLSSEHPLRDSTLADKQLAHIRMI